MWPRVHQNNSESLPVQPNPPRCSSPRAHEKLGTDNAGPCTQPENRPRSVSPTGDETEVFQVPVVQCSHSCPSGDTVPVTPNTILQNFTNRMPIGAAVSTDLSASVGTMSRASLSPRRSDLLSPSTTNFQTPARRTNASQSLVSSDADQDASHVVDGVTTRGMIVLGDSPPPRPPRLRFEIGMLPRITSGALAANKPCFILHPDHGDTVVAEGKTGGSWKSPSQKLGALCLEGQQMVQVHKIIKTGLPLIFSEQRHPFTTLDQALVKPSGSGVYVKWYSRLLHKKPKSVRGG